MAAIAASAAAAASSAAALLRDAASPEAHPWRAKIKKNAPMIVAIILNI
jgi:hypothetical protein